MRRALEAVRSAPDNVSEAELRAAPPSRGWRRDDRRRALPPEMPGDPEPDGSFAMARGLVADYEFSDPRRVRAAFDPAEPLDGRVMLLELRWLVLRFLCGVRIVRVYDEDRDGGRARVWGWTYRTLAGHVEAGERSFEVWKWRESGTVEFRTHAVSRVAWRNPVMRVGFRLFGRPRQRRWVDAICRRMDHLTAAALARRGALPAPPARPGGLVEHPALPEE
jgi:uncharacterized protein (UPF0548 family)